MRSQHVVVIGAGVGGLSAAVDLAARGTRVTLVERAATLGGKMREVAVGLARIDAGPTVFTMRWVFDELFAHAGASLADHLTLHPAGVLARHAWSKQERLDLFADTERSADAIGMFAGAAEAAGFRDFCRRARRVYETLEGPFIRAAKPSPASLVRAAGLRGLPDLWRISPFETLWNALGEHFADRRLQQLFARYSTYCGSSPFLAPATLMLIAHVERDGVWLVEGGMHRVVLALAALASSQGAVVRTGAEVAEIAVERGRASGIRLASGEQIAADAVVLNADAAALAAGLFGADATAAAEPMAVAERSLSAVTWAMVAQADGFPLLHHTVFFSADYASEFEDLFRRRVVPQHPTVYVCAQDRGDRDDRDHSGSERLFCLINAPATGDERSPSASEIDTWTARTFGQLERCGLHLGRSEAAAAVTTPADFARLFPATGGALYGRATHGPMASFRRPTSRSRLPGLYLAGGSAHPGAGVPMAALSGRLAAARVCEDLASTSLSRPVAMRGGMSMR